MAKSTRFGKTYTKMQKLSESLVLLGFVLIMNSACNSSIQYQDSAYVEPYLRDSIPYTLARHEEPAERILLFLPPALDTVKFENSPLYHKFYESGYDILSVYKAEAKGAYYYSRKAMDFKNQNVQNVQNLIQHLRRENKISKEGKFHILAMEQGIYMAPAIASFVNADTLFLVNGNPFSTFYGLQRIADGTFPWDEKRQSFVRENFEIDSLETFKEKVQEVEGLTSEQYSLGQFMNMYWQSYHANYFLDEYARLQGHTCWIYYKDYPLFKESDLDYQKLLDRTRVKSSGNHYLLEGRGLPKEKEEWETLSESLEGYFKE